MIPCAPWTAIGFAADIASAGLSLGTQLSGVGYVGESTAGSAQTDRFVDNVAAKAGAVVALEKNDEI